MRKHTIAALACIMLASIALWGCPKKSEVSSSPLAGNAETSAATAQNGGSGTEAAAPSGKDERSAAASGGLHPIFFEYNKSVIRAEARKLLAEDAQWLKANPAVKVEIEGNCDERGTAEYNQALGQRRAASAKKYLADLGIASRRISLISFGKEKPVCREETEECWQKNRRDDLVAAP